MLSLGRSASGSLCSYLKRPFSKLVCLQKARMNAQPQMSLQRGLANISDGVLPKAQPKVCLSHRSEIRV